MLYSKQCGAVDENLPQLVKELMFGSEAWLVSLKSPDYDLYNVLFIFYLQLTFKLCRTMFVVNR